MLGVKLNSRGGIDIDDKLRTSVKEVYAVSSIKKYLKYNTCTHIFMELLVLFRLVTVREIGNCE